MHNTNIVFFFFFFVLSFFFVESDVKSYALCFIGDSTVRMFLDKEPFLPKSSPYYHDKTAQTFELNTKNYKFLFLKYYREKEFGSINFVCNISLIGKYHHTPSTNISLLFNEDEFDKIKFKNKYYIIPTIPQTNNYIQKKEDVFSLYDACYKKYTICYDDFFKVSLLTEKKYKLTKSTHNLHFMDNENYENQNKIILETFYNNDFNYLYYKTLIDLKNKLKNRA